MAIDHPCYKQPRPGFPNFHLLVAKTDQKVIIGSKCDCAYISLVASLKNNFKG
jgi:hypothetical protein